MQRITDDGRDVPPDMVGALSASRNIHPIERLPAEDYSQQMGVMGPGTNDCRTSSG